MLKSSSSFKFVIALMIVLSALAVAGSPYRTFANELIPASRFVIAIDPGHPSETSNGCAHHGVTELQICWDVALKLEQLIASEPDMLAIKTKPAVDTMVTNRQRAELANDASATIMVRLHCDSANGSGCTIYYPDKQGTVQGVTGPSEEIITQSRIAAECMQNGMSQILGTQLKLNPIKTDSVTFVGAKQGALTGSIFARVPAVVVEMVYLNNASDAAFIKAPEGQDLLARAMLAGIREFIKEK